MEWLDRLVLCGKASFGTFVAGGSEKPCLEVDSNRFVIITGFTFFPYSDTDNTDAIDDWFTRMIIQMQIVSDKSKNNFVFRNNFGSNVYITGGDPPVFNNYYQPGCPVTIDNLFLIHESDVAFLFSFGTRITPVLTNTTPPEGVGLAPPSGYGKRGLRSGGNPIAVVQEAATVSPSHLYNVGGRGVPSTKGVFNANELRFPVVDPTTTFAEIASQWQYPIVNVKYYEIQGNPHDLAPNL